MDDAQAQQTNPLFGIIPKEFFTPLASPNRLVYWDCLCRLFQAMSAQLSFGIEREILVDELQFYFEQNQAAEFEEDDTQTSGACIPATYLLQNKGIFK